MSAQDVQAIDRLAALSGVNRSEIIRAAIAAVLADPQLATRPPLDEPEPVDEFVHLDDDEAFMRAFEREHFGM